MNLKDLTAVSLTNSFLEDAARGLSSPTRYIPSQYFYDERGSELFSQIMNLDEYYPTKCEAEIFKNSRGKLCALMGSQPFALVDIGAGDAKKTKILIEAFVSGCEKFTYVPIDISRDALIQLEESLNKEFPGLEVYPVAAEYFQGLRLVRDEYPIRRLALFMGGNIGNFKQSDALVLLRRMATSLAKGDMLLVGFDLKKNPRTILKAYDDAQGVTREFNMNLLVRMNRELGFNFDLSHWAHYASYNPQSGAVESFLVSNKQQKVYSEALKTEYDFEAWEAIHTEFSFKYSLPEVEEFAWKAGFEVVEHFTDSKEWFVDSLWRVKG